jgi:hypothetical protein
MLYFFSWSLLQLTHFNLHSSQHKSSQYFPQAHCSHDTDYINVSDTAHRPPVACAGVIGLSDAVFVDVFFPSPWKFSM